MLHVEEVDGGWRDLFCYRAFQDCAAAGFGQGRPRGHSTGIIHVYRGEGAWSVILVVAPEQMYMSI
jgi:hypothetical protein